MDSSDQTLMTFSQGTHKHSIPASADASIQELVAFYELIDDISTSSSRTVEDWVATNIEHINKQNTKNLRDLFYQVAENISEIARNLEDQLSGVEVEPFMRTISISDKEVADALRSFLVEMSTHMVDRSKLTCRAFLIAAESSFEILFSQLARAIYRKNPSALARSDYAFTLEQLSSYDSIDSAREALVTQKIEALLRESVDEWGRWLKRTVNIPLDGVMEDWSTTREIFIRRNMLVHTDGVITKRYIEEVRKAGAPIEGLTIGHSLVPSVGYLRSSLERLVALEILLTFRVWSRLDKNQLNEAAGWLGGQVQRLVSRKMWTSVCLICQEFNDISCRRSIQLSVQVDGWLARKKRDGIVVIQEEVSSWDVSALDARYKTLKGLLLDSITAEELEDAAQNGHVSRFEMGTHPLFENFRESGRSVATQGNSIHVNVNDDNPGDSS